MSETQTGGCACGAIRYEIVGEPVSMQHCQCRQCQRGSGTGHQSYVTFVGAKVTMTGEASFWESTGDGGTVKRRGFCPVCGSPVYVTFPSMPDVLIVTPTSLDDSSVFKPKFVTWTSSAQAWDRMDPVLPKFETMPS